MTPPKLTPALRAKKFEFYFKLIGGIVIGLIGSVIAATAIYGILGLMVAAVLILTSITVWPWLAMKAGNWKLKMIKHEARTSPVETLQNLKLDRQKALDEQQQRLEKFNGQVRSFETTVDNLRKEFPADAPKYMKMLAGMQQLLEVRKKKWRQAKASLADFDREIKRAEMIWKVGCAAMDTADSAGMNEDDFYAQLKAETAYESVSDKMNEAFTQLDMAMTIEQEQTVAAPGPLLAALGNGESAAPIAFRTEVREADLVD